MGSSERSRILITIIVTILACAAFYATGRFRRDERDYAKFAGDEGSRAANVLSNAGFLAVGIIGIARVVARREQLRDDFAPALVLFAGVLLTAFGSAWFHAWPLKNGETNADTLLVDRLPMAIAFAGLIALALRDRVFDRPHPIVLPLLMILGCATVVWWYATTDLAPYAFFQAWTALGTLLALIAFRPRFSRGRDLVAALLLFGAAKVFEGGDRWIYAHTRSMIAGHPLKHIAGAVAAWMVLVWLMRREPLTPPAPLHPPR